MPPAALSTSSSLMPPLVFLASTYTAGEITLSSRSGGGSSSRGRGRVRAFPMLG